MDTDIWYTWKFLTDNSREFANLKFIDMTKSMNITVKKVAEAESAFRNGLVERQAEMTDEAFENHSISTWI